MTREVNGLPRRYRECTFESFEPVSASQRQALAACQNLAAGKLGGLMLLGGTGRGKTHLAAATATAAFLAHPDYDRRSEWVNVPALISDLRTEIESGDNDARTLAVTMRAHKGLVVLDDLGHEKITDWTGELVYVLINSRYEAMLPTMGTSNLDPTELRDNGYWAPISRLAEGGAVILVKGPDRRLPAAG